MRQNNTSGEEYQNYTQGGAEWNKKAGVFHTKQSQNAHILVLRLDFEVERNRGKVGSVQFQQLGYKKVYG